MTPTTEEDAEFILELLNTPKWIRYIGDRNVNTVDDARLYIRNRITPQFERLGYGNYTIASKAGNIKMGSCGLYDREGLDGIDIGFAFLPGYEGQGYAFEAARALRDMAFSDFGLEKISAITTKDNATSQKLLEKLGLTLSGTFTAPGSEEELLLYKISL